MNRHNANGWKFVIVCVGVGIVLSVLFLLPKKQTSKANPVDKEAISVTDQPDDNGRIEIGKHIPLSHSGYGAKVTAINDVDSEKATMVLEVTNDDAAEYCQRDPGGETVQYGGKLTVDQCISKVMGVEEYKNYTVEADCLNKGLTGHDGHTYHITGLDDVNSPVWYDENDQYELIPAASETLTVHFAYLCPSKVDLKQMTLR